MRDRDIAYYVASGSVRGDCRHRHQTAEAAERCAERDHRDVQRGHPGGGAYSDREVVAVYCDGSRECLGRPAFEASDED